MQSEMTTDKIMADEVSLSIDGTEVTVPGGTTIFLAAQRVGIDIPHLCYDPNLSLPPTCFGNFFDNFFRRHTEKHFT